MSAAIDHSQTMAEQPTDAPAVLAKWYAKHSAIRRLRALEGEAEVTVIVSLEPTFDGDDAMPAWLANNRRWVLDLSALMRREVRLELSLSTAFTEPDIDADTAIIAELSWRESWVMGPDRESDEPVLTVE